MKIKSIRISILGTLIRRSVEFQIRSNLTVQIDLQSREKQKWVMQWMISLQTNSKRIYGVNEIEYILITFYYYILNCLILFLNHPFFVITSFFPFGKFLLVELWCNMYSSKFREGFWYLFGNRTSESDFDFSLQNILLNVLFFLSV